MQGLMMDMPLLLSGLIEYAADYHGATEIVSRTIEGDVQRYGYADAHRRIKRLAKALLRLGAKPGMRIGTLAWNTREHFEMFYGVTGTGAVLHTVNPRLFPDQLVYIINHAEDEFVFCDAATLPIVEAIAPKLATVKRFVVMAPEARMPRTGLANPLCYETLLAAEDDDYAWPQFDERNASTICYTSAPPRALVAKLERDYGVETMQAWGMTEALMATSCSLKPGHGDLPFERRLDYRMKSGRGIFGVKTRIVDDEGNELPRDGKAFGHLRAKGPWIASGYLKGEGGSALDEQGWLTTGDMATIDAEGHVLLTDRSKDVIKSGGEWISSIQLEDAALSHPDVLQAAVIAVPHPTWQERPLLLIVPKAGARIDATAIIDHLRPRVASWWLPDAVELVDKFPMTATGKVHKLTLPQQYKDYDLQAKEHSSAPHGP